MTDRHGLSTTTLSRMGDISVKEVFAAPSSKIRDEVVAVFISQEVRDTVKRAARELAGDRDAGIRLEIPRYLQPSLKALEAVSYALKKKHPALKRNVKFDDEFLDLVLDFNLDPSRPGSSWRKLRPRQARSVRQKLVVSSSGPAEEVGDDELDTMLGTSVT